MATKELVVEEKRLAAVRIRKEKAAEREREHLCNISDLDRLDREICYGTIHAEIVGCRFYSGVAHKGSSVGNSYFLVLEEDVFLV